VSDTPSIRKDLRRFLELPDRRLTGFLPVDGAIAANAEAEPTGRKDRPHQDVDVGRHQDYGLHIDNDGRLRSHNHPGLHLNADDRLGSHNHHGRHMNGDDRLGRDDHLGRFDQHVPRVRRLHHALALSARFDPYQGEALTSADRQRDLVAGLHVGVAPSRLAGRDQQAVDRVDRVTFSELPIRDSALSDPEDHRLGAKQPNPFASLTDVVAAVALEATDPEVAPRHLACGASLCPRLCGRPRHDVLSSRIRYHTGHQADA
jgi:hypothetical protein